MEELTFAKANIDSTTNVSIKCFNKLLGSAFTVIIACSAIAYVDKVISALIIIRVHNHYKGISMVIQYIQTLVIARFIYQMRKKVTHLKCIGIRVRVGHLYYQLELIINYYFKVIL